jgi:hypothetical protein
MPFGIDWIKAELVNAGRGSAVACSGSFDSVSKQIALGIRRARSGASPYLSRPTASHASHEQAESASNGSLVPVGDFR